MKDLIIAAEAALVQLKEHHSQDIGQCPGAQQCPTAAAIATLEAEIAKAKLGQDFETDPQFQAVAPFKVEDYIPTPVNPPPATIDVGNPHIAAQILDAAAAIEVRPMFMPGRRLCVQCDAVLPSTTHAAVTRCERCMA